MALTRLSDAIVPEVFTDYMLKETMEKSAIFESGLVVPDSFMAGLLSGGGRTFNHPYWNDLDNTEADIATDNPADVAVPGKIAAVKKRFIRQVRTKGWSDADLVSVLAGDDPMKRIASRVGAYWKRQFQRYTIATLNGILADNVANDGSDMVNDISAGSGTAAMISAEAVIDTKQTMGDAASVLTTIVMHSVLNSRLAKLDLIDFRPDSEGKLTIPTYLGYDVIVDDLCPAVVNGSDIDYTTYLCGPGVIGFSEVPVDVPVEVDRLPAQGQGSGVEQLWTRRQFALHPYGFDWLDASIAGEFPTIAEMETAGNWSRSYPERKQVAIAALITKNG